MYRCRMKIAIFSKEDMLSELVRSLEPLEHFTHEITVLPEANQEIMREGRLVIWNLDDPVLPSKLRSQCGEDAVFIFCGSRRRIGTLPPEELEAANEFWETPPGRDYIKVRLMRIMEQIKLRYDYYMTRTYLDTAIDSIPDMLWFKTLDGIHVKVNKAFCSVVGKTREDVTGQRHCYIWGVSPDDYENGEASCRESEDAVIKARRTLQFTESVKGAHGMRQLRTYKSPIVDRDGVTVLGTVGIGHDVTDLVNMSAEIEILLQSMPYAILLWDNNGKILNANRKFEEYFRLPREEVIGQDYDEWLAGAFEEQRFINSEGYVEARVSHGDGTGKMLEIHENSVYDVFNHVAGKLCIFRDVTVERDLEKQIRHSSNTDFLTGLYNRRCFYQYIHNNRGSRTVSLMYIDLDRFKEVNDTYGHKVGDAVLVHTADVLRDFFKEDFVARLGGDEFLVVRLGKCCMDQLKQEAEAFLKEMSTAFQAAEQTVALSASVGIAQSSDSQMDIDALLQRSDQALYQAKKEGRSRYCVYR